MPKPNKYNGTGKKSVWSLSQYAWNQWNGHKDSQSDDESIRCSHSYTRYVRLDPALSSHLCAWASLNPTFRDPRLCTCAERLLTNDCILALLIIQPPVQVGTAGS